MFRGWVSPNVAMVGAVNWFTRLSEATRVAVLAVLAAAVAGAPTLADLGKGWRVAGAVAGPVLIVVSALLSHLAQRQAKRLDISLETQPDPVVVPAFPGGGDAIGRWLVNERGECLASVAPPAPPEPPPDTQRSRRGGFRAADVSDDPAETPAGDDRAPDTVDDPAEQEASEPLTPAQRQIAASAANMFATANAVAAQFASMFDALSQPDRRTEDEYRSQVEEYLASAEEQLHAHLRWNFFETGKAHLCLLVVNNTDRPFESVQVEVRLPGPVEAVDPDMERQPPENLPSRPKPFGKRTMSWEVSGGPSLLGFIPPHVGFPGLSAGLDIDNTGSAHVTFPPFTLRPRSQVTLDPVHLVIRAEPGAVIDGTWTATATNAEGRAGGALRVHVASAPGVVELLSGELGG